MIELRTIKDTRPFAIYDDNTLIGFVSMYVGEETYQIINFLIDDAFQKKGLGTEAAQRFWRKLGSDFSDNVEDGYIFMRLTL